MGSLEWFILVLATWRVSSLLVNERGPFDLFLRLRSWAGIQHDSQGRSTIIPDGLLSGVLSCVWCASVWVGAGWAAAYWLWPDYALPVALALALSAAAVLVETWLRNR